jgi:hypothetical protein
MGRRCAGLTAAACLTTLAACGGSSTTRTTQADREWSANASGVIDQLRRDLVLAASGGDTLASARLALGDVSRLYTILVAYTDFGGCRHMVAAAGATPARYRPARAVLVSACGLLERGAALFTRATTRHDAGALLAAARTTARAAPLLLRARAALEAATPRRDRG